MNLNTIIKIKQNMIMKKSITKKIMLGVCLMILGVFAHAQNGLEKIIVEKYYVSNADDSIASIGTLPVGSVTYRIYVDMLPGYTFQMAYGNKNHTLKIATTTSFFNNEDRGDIEPKYTKTQAKNNTVMLDSWLSVGAACAGNFGILKTDDNGVATVVNSDGVLKNNDPTAGIPLTIQDGMIAGSPNSVTFVGLSSELDVFNSTSQLGNLFITNNGAWACQTGVPGQTPGAVGPNADTNRILIAQITTDGKLSFELNIQLGTPSGGLVKFVANNPIGSEIQIPSLTYPQANIHTPPTVSITSPLNNTKFKTGDVVAISANAASIDGTISSVEFFVNGTSIGTATSAPYTMNWTSIKGRAILTAKAKDNLDSVKISIPDTIYVVDHVLPTVSITSPANNASYKIGDVVAIAANAASSDGTIASVEFFVNGVSIGTSTLAPYTINWTSIKGTAIITAKAKDNLDSVTTSAPVTISIPDSHIPPTVSITSPVNNASFKIGDVVTISANATPSEGTILSVEFFVNGSSIGVVNSAPYTINWNSISGTAIITAKAKDNVDSVSTSAPVTISINVGINKMNLSNNAFNVYPNPFKNALTLEFNTSYQSNANTYKIYDITGKILLSKIVSSFTGKHKENIDMSSFSNGQYFIELSIDGIKFTRKIIKD